jgi:pyridoxamine 5'-phosphate oxidase
VSEWVPLDVADCDPNPFVQFQRWFDEAREVMADREAIALVTSTLDGRASARMVLLRYLDGRSFGWYTNYDSRKGGDLAANPHAALLWYNAAQGRQVRIEGTVERMDPALSDAYFASRVRGHQIGAHASAQSQPLESRRELEDRVCDLENGFAGADVPRPDGWGGYVLTPILFEFWQHREDRLHDRVLYQPDGAASDGAWSRQRLSP